MKPEVVLAYEFVEFIPDDLKDRTLYISITYCTAAHKCCCGCGSEVVTPLSPTDWKLTFDGETITLHPSIGNWGFKCQSHYWIRDSRVRWARRWSREEIDAGRVRDRYEKDRYFHIADTATYGSAREKLGTVEPRRVKLGLWQKVKDWWHRS